jgi:Ser/Thr protein kinase RdoA (MazF antagonist)
MPEGQAAEIARHYYGVQASARRLPSEHDDTFRLALNDGSARFLRVSPPDPALAGTGPASTAPASTALAGTVPESTVPESTAPAGPGPADALSPGTAGVSFLTAILLHLASAAPDLPVQRIVRSLDGAPEVWLRSADGAADRIARMTTFLDGSLLRDVSSCPGLRRDIGATLATLSRALRRFTHPAAHRTHLWDLQNAPALRAHVDQLPDGGPGAGAGPGVDATLRGQLLAVLDRFEHAVRPALAGTPVQVIHTDFHGDNLLADSGRITGVLDFGDSLTGPVAMDVAVAACYQLGAGSGNAGSCIVGSGNAGSDGARSDRADLLEPALDVVTGYHAVDPLRPADLPLIAEFIQLRLATRIIVSQRNAAREPANAGYLLRKTPQAIEHFAAFRAIGAETVVGRLRSVCGLD